MNYSKQVAERLDGVVHKPVDLVARGAFVQCAAGRVVLVRLSVARFCWRLVNPTGASSSRLGG